MVPAQATSRTAAIAVAHPDGLQAESARFPGWERTALLDGVYTGLQAAPIQELVDRQLDALFGGLADLRQESRPDEWREMIARCRQHPLREIVHQDPFTSRAYSKPRGYAGDAVMLDYIYGREELWPEPDATPLGRAIFRYTTAAPASAGVRGRRGFVAEFLDRLTESVPHPHVLSVAAGHLREAALSSAVRRRRLGRFVALDSDPESLKEVVACYGPYGVETCHADLRKLLTGRNGLGRFDLVYSTGLFDYLHETTGRRLVRNMFDVLNPGGRLLLANFLPEIRDIGYMEAFMDWNLVYRTRHDMLDLTRDVPQREIHSLRIFAEENQNIIFLEICRR